MTKNETWNGQRDFPITGHYLEILSTVNTIDIKAFAADGSVLHDERAVQTGYYIDRRGILVDSDGRLIPSEPFVRLEITTGALEAVKFVVSDGLSGSRGSIDVSDRGGRLIGTPYGSLAAALAQLALGGVNALVTSERGFTYGASFQSVTALATVTNETALAPGSNTAGVIVWAANISSSQPTAAGTSSIGLIAKSSAPASGIDGDVLLTCVVREQTAVGIASGNTRLDRPVFVATGKGLYFRNSGANNEGDGYRSILYTAL
jgi:hypothetical protein